jgi:hypothetical protein
MHEAQDFGTIAMQSENLPGQDISVSTVQLADELMVFEITATSGLHSETQRHAIGAGGTNPTQPTIMTADDLDSFLAVCQQRVADNVAWHAAMDSASARVQASAMQRASSSSKSPTPAEPTQAQ